MEVKTDRRDKSQQRNLHAARLLTPAVMCSENFKTTCLVQIQEEAVLKVTSFLLFYIYFFVWGRRCFRRRCGFEKFPLRNKHLSLCRDTAAEADWCEPQPNQKRFFSSPRPGKLADVAFCKTRDVHTQTRESPAKKHDNPWGLPLTPLGDCY